MLAKQPAQPNPHRVVSTKRSRRYESHKTRFGMSKRCMINIESGIPIVFSPFQKTVEKITTYQVGREGGVLQKKKNPPTPFLAPPSGFHLRSVEGSGSIALIFHASTFVFPSLISISIFSPNLRPPHHRHLQQTQPRENKAWSTLRKTKVYSTFPSLCVDALN